LHGEKTSPEKIWEPINFSGANDTLELHDSGGFEGTKSVQEVKNILIRSDPSHSLAKSTLFGI